MPEQVLIYSRFPESLMARLGARYELLESAGQSPVERFTAQQLAPVRAIVAAGGQALPKTVLDAMPSLGAIVCYGTGYDGIDVAEAKARNIVVGNSPGANAGAVADLALLLMLAATRQVILADRYVRSGDWAAARPSALTLPPPDMQGRKIGLYGMGKIGRKIAARCAAFEARVGYFSRSRHDVPYEYHPSLDALAAWSDVMIVAVRAGPDTHHKVDAALLRKLGPQGVIVNVARGSVVDEQALVEALTNRAIAGAGLDVYESEPHAPDALTRLDNVVLTPHIGGHTAAAHTAKQDCVLANLEAFFAGRPLAYPVG
jgi:lactate dehydrogenase-like 2-hydroxyacid dehydrogenase